MVAVVGTYKLERNENIDAFYAAAGVPWIARKMMSMTSPTVYVNQEKNEEGDEIWFFRTVTFTRTINLSFKVDQPFEDTLPSGDVYKTLAKMEGDNKFILESTNEEKGDFIREYEFSESGLVMTLKHPSGVTAKRYFNRIEA